MKSQELKRHVIWPPNVFTCCYSPDEWEMLYLVVQTVVKQSLNFLTMAECINCGAYTKFNKGLCFECYQEKNAADGPGHAVSEADISRRFNNVKGRIAETLIQELFLCMGYNVFSYGMENTIPAIMKLLKNVRSDVANDIRRMPDFVIQNPANNEVYFVEVKFRANETFVRRDLGKDYPWTNSYFILVSKKHIKCITFNELENGQEITPSSKNYLGNRK